MRCSATGSVSRPRPRPRLRRMNSVGGRVLVDPSQSSSWYFDRPRTRRRPCGSRAGSDHPAARLQERGRDRGSRRAHASRRRSLTRFLHRVATDAQASLPNETEIAEKLEGFREATGAPKDLSFDTIAGRRLQRRHRALPAHPPARQDDGAAARCCWSIPAISTSTAPPDKTCTPGCRREPSRRCASGSTPGAQGTSPWPASTSRTGPPAARSTSWRARRCGRRPRLRPRHRPRGRQLSGISPCAHRCYAQHGGAEGHDRFQRAATTRPAPTVSASRTCRW